MCVFFNEILPMAPFNYSELCCNFQSKELTTIFCGSVRWDKKGYLCKSLIIPSAHPFTQGQYPTCAHRLVRISNLVLWGLPLQRSYLSDLDLCLPILEIDTGVNGGLYPDLAKKRTTLNKFHRYIDMSPCPYVLHMPSLHSLLAL